MASIDFFTMFEVLGLLGFSGIRENKFNLKKNMEEIQLKKNSEK